METIKKYILTDAVCRHYPRREYDGRLCHFDLDEVTDAYEVSLCAVPAQPKAGAVKAKRYGGAEAPEEQEPQGAEAPDDDILLAKHLAPLAAELRASIAYD